MRGHMEYERGGERCIHPEEETKRVGPPRAFRNGHDIGIETERYRQLIVHVCVDVPHKE
jgi:hypothetical protein